MAGEGIWVLDPTGIPDIKPKRLARRPEDLAGVRLGILWNEKPNGDILLRQIQEDLERRFRPKSVVWKLRGATSSTDPRVLGDLGATCDVVVNAVAD